MKIFTINLVYLFALLILPLIMDGPVLANASGTGAVFVATNQAPNTGYNRIVMYTRAADGTLSLTDVEQTRGYGIGPGANLTGLPFGTPGLESDPIGSQDSLAVDENNRFLFVTNAGSDQVSVLRIEPTGLTHIQTVSSGGVFPNSLTVRDGILYVLNAGGTSNFKGFRVNQTSGQLTPLVGGQCSLLPPLNYWPRRADTGDPERFAVPGQISFTPDGDKLVISRKEGPTEEFALTGPTVGPGRFDLYALNGYGIPVNCNNPAVNINARANVPAGYFPFSFTFSEKGHLLSVEVVGVFVPTTPIGSSSMSSYQIKPQGELKLITGSLGNDKSAICWIVRSGQFVYGSNNFSDSISTYVIRKNGTLEYLAAKEMTVGAGTFPLDMALSGDGHFLYILAPGTAQIYAYQIDKVNGDLTLIDIVGIAGTAPISGQAGMATAEF